jgi:hypothetical protein
MDDFTRGFLVAALWTETDESREGRGDPLDQNYDFSDLSSDTVEHATRDCERFQRENAALLERYYDARAYDPDQGTPQDYAGHDFLLTRNGHGAGFWDRGLGELGDALTEACKPYGEFSLYVGCDGEIYSMGRGMSGGVA